MDQICLQNKEVFPDAEVLKNVLGDVFPVYETFVEMIASHDFGFILAWNYYSDGKAWLCKVSYKKKTICWLSVWNQYFKIGLYFSDKTKDGVLLLPIDSSTMQEFISVKPIGKLRPLTLSICSVSQLDDLYRLLIYKRNLN